MLRPTLRWVPLFWVLFLSSVALAGEWTQLSPPDSPPARMFAGVAFDEARGRLVLFGGTPSFDRTTFYNDTWEWDGTTWLHVSTPNSPPGRHAMYMAYDSDRNVVVLYGGQHGFGGGSSWDDMWEYDGIDWTQAFPAATPGSRGEGAMAFDRDRHVMVLYGGHIGGGGDLNDTWEYDGETWRQVVTPTVPALANNQGMVYDHASHRILMYGGCGNGDRAWRYDGDTWSAGAPGPAGRNVHSMGYSPPTGRTVVFGGSVDCSNQQRQDTWEWNGSSWAEAHPVVSPSARWGMPMVYVPANGGLLGFGGGSTGQASADTWLYTPDCPTPCDSDGDGYTWPVDCDDADPNIHPGALEACDGFDNDCDGQPDDAPGCDRTCDLIQSQPIARITVSSTHSVSPALVWNGTEYGLTWDALRDGNHEIYFVRLDASGQRIGPDMRISNNPAVSRAPSLVWTGSGYGLAWEDDRDLADFQMPSNEVYFARLTPSGQIVGTEIRVTTALEWSISPSIQWNGSAYGLAWGDARDSDWEIYFAALDSTGTKLQERRITNVSGEAELPSLVWTGSQYGLAWNDARGGSREIYLALLDDAGQKVADEVRITNHFPYSARNVSLGWTGEDYSLAWMDPRTGSPAIWFTTRKADATEALPQEQLTSPTNPADSPRLAWTGEEYGVAWTGREAGNGEIYFSRLSAAGVKVGPDIRITSDPAESSEPSLAWTGIEYGVAWQDSRDGHAEIYFARISCNCVDADQDGFTVCAECNDANAAINPGAPDACNAIDDNCNGLIDEDANGLDSDGDGIHNACDNCKFAYNPTQVDTDHDSIGNSCDNCLLFANSSQADLDGDQRGDVCDNCPAASNGFQDDTDADSVGDVCDNCVLVSNPDQGDVNSDFVGNACDLNDGLILVRLSDDFTIEWQQEAGFEAFNWYRGDLSVLKGSGLYTQDPNTVPLAGRECALADAYTFDFSDPPVGRAVFFLVTGVHLGVESSLGNSSAGVERTNANPCP